MPVVGIVGVNFPSARPCNSFAVERVEKRRVEYIAGDNINKGTEIILTRGRR